MSGSQPQASSGQSQPVPRDLEKLLKKLEWTVIRRLDGLLHGDYRTLFRGFGLDLADLREYQYHDDVRHIEEVIPRKLLNSVARRVLRVPSGNPAPGSEGEGEIVAVADTGFDKGSTTDVHPAFKGRVKKLYALGRPNRKDDPDGHGTHVAGSVLGDGVSTADGPVRGTAPMM